MPFKKRQARRPRRKTMPKKRMTKKTSLVKTIKRVIHQQIENKQWYNYAANQSIQTCSGAAVPFLYSLLPTLSQSALDNGRIGNQVTVVKNNFTYCVNLLPYNAITNPSPLIYLKMWVVSLKNKSQFEGTPLLSDFNNFFEVGNSSLNFQGNTLDTLFRVNNELFTVHATRVHTLGTSGSTPASSTNIYGGSNNPQARGTIYLGKYAKQLKYNDAGTIVSNRSLWLVIQPVTQDGSTGTGYISSEIHYNHEVSYEDA